jgi:hypothetical protein
MQHPTGIYAEWAQRTGDAKMVDGGRVKARKAQAYGSREAQGC